MLRIEGQDVYLTRGDTAYLQLIPKLQNKELYVLKQGDQIKFRLRDGSFLFEKDCDIDVENNFARLTLLPDDTVGLKYKMYRYECELITVDQEHFTFIADRQFTIGKELDDHGE